MIKKILILVAVLVSLTLWTGSARAQGCEGQGTDCAAYSHDANATTTYKDWMGALPDGLYLSQMSIPGTHDTGTFLGIGGDIAQAQSMNIQQQLDAGIRMFDIRLGNSNICQLDSSGLWIFHGTVCQGTRFETVLGAVTSFLTAHPKEAVLMSIRNEDVNDVSDLTAEVANELQNGGAASFLYTGADLNPTLGALRGKIFIFDRFSGGEWTYYSLATVRSWCDGNDGTAHCDPDVGPDRGITNTGGWTQDHYDLSNDWSLADKWRDAVTPEDILNGSTDDPGVLDQLEQADHSLSKDPYTLYVNFLSGSTGGFPYFYASGKSSSGTGDPQLLTGWTRGIIDTCGSPGRHNQCIPEYPNVNCFLGTCSVEFLGINYLTENLLYDSEQNNTPVNRTGITMMDFPGADLIGAIIRANSRVSVNKPPDTSAPAAKPTQSPAANANGWNNTSVTINWNWTDNTGGSGLDPTACTTTSTVTGQGIQTANATCSDLDGNIGKASYATYIDEVQPTINAAATENPVNQFGSSCSIATCWYNASTLAADGGAVDVRFNCQDNAGGSGIDPEGGCPADQFLIADGAAVSSTTETAVDLAGNVSHPSNIVTVKIDKTPPTITAAATTSPHASGWYNGNVIVHFTCFDATSGIAPGACPVDQTLSAQGAAVSSTVETVSDVAGNVSALSSIVTVKIDKTPPTITAAVTTLPNAAGWYRGNVIVHFTCSDALSGIPAGACPGDQILSAQGAAVSSTAQTVADAAGNVSMPSNIATVKIDKTPPGINAVLTPPPNVNGWNNSSVTVTFVAADALSGVAAVSSPVVVNAQGAGQVVTGTATDNAGNTSSMQVVVNLDETAPEAYFQFYPDTHDIAFFAQDPLSGAAPGPIPPVSVSAVGHDRDRGRGHGHDRDDDHEQLRTYKALDLAGNSITVVARVMKKDSELKMEVVSLQYNARPVITLPRNDGDFKWDIDRGKLTELHQSFATGMGRTASTVTADYDLRRNETIIQQGDPKHTEPKVESGLVLIQLATSKGVLKIEE